MYKAGHFAKTGVGIYYIVNVRGTKYDIVIVEKTDSEGTSRGALSNTMLWYNKAGDMGPSAKIKNTLYTKTIISIFEHSMKQQLKDIASYGE